MLSTLDNLIFRKELEDPRMEINFTYNSDHDPQSSKAIRMLIQDRFPAPLSEPSEEIYHLVSAVARHSRIFPVPETVLARIIESKLRGNPATYFERWFESSDLKKTTRALLQRFGGLKDLFDLKADFIKKEVLNPTDDEEIDSLLNMGLRAYPESKMSEVQQKCILKIKSTLSHDQLVTVLKAEQCLGSLEFEDFLGVMKRCIKNSEQIEDEPPPPPQ